MIFVLAFAVNTYKRRLSELRCNFNTSTCSVPSNNDGDYMTASPKRSSLRRSDTFIINSPAKETKSLIDAPVKDDSVGRHKPSLQSDAGGEFTLFH